MRRVNLLRSTPFRLAIVFVAMVVLAFAATGLAVQQLMKWELRRHQDQAITETYTVIADAYGDSDLTDLLETVETNVRATRDLQRIFLVTNQDDEIVGGNIGKLDVPMGWNDVGGVRLGLDPDLAYRVFAGIVDGNRLVVGMSQQELDSLQEILTSSFVWAALLAALLAISGGAWLAYRAQRRFDAVRDTMNAVSHGKLDARVPLIGRGDDIDLLSRNINEALARLEKTVEGMRQVSADIAHDLKSPLNRLRMTLEDALEKQQSGTSVTADLVEAGAEADQINETFEALLRISQIESGSRKSRFTRVDLANIFRTLMEIYGSVAEDSQQSLELDAASEVDFTILGDRELLTQMFANLVENAIRHTPPGASIALRLRCDEKQGVATVEDNGPGIPASEHENIFRRLYRLEKSRTSQGNGLGLSLVKAIADLHEATVQVVELAPGIRFEIRFSTASVRAARGI